MSKTDEENETERVQINFRASRKQKEKWEEYAEEAGFGSFSDFIRVALENELRSEGGKTDRGSDASGPSTQTMADLLQTTKTVNSQIGELQEDIRIIKSELKEDESLRSLKNEVFSALPEEGDDFEGVELSVGDMESIGATVEGIARKVDAEESRVQEALRMLIDETTLVDSVEVDGRTCYYKEV